MITDEPRRWEGGMADSPSQPEPGARSGRRRFGRAKPALALLQRITRLLPVRIRSAAFGSTRMVNGDVGLMLRYLSVSTLAKDCGDNVGIHPGTYMFGLENLSLGTNVSIHPMCYIDASGGMAIGSDVSIAHGATILSTAHTFTDLDIPIKYQPIQRRRTEIGDGVWIGAKATILAGTRIGPGAVVGAGAVVTADIPDCAIAVGVPARVIAQRLDRESCARRSRGSMSE